jgi:hypothetical protein
MFLRRSAGVLIATDSLLEIVANKLKSWCIIFFAGVYIWKIAPPPFFRGREYQPMPFERKSMKKGKKKSQKMWEKWRRWNIRGNRECKKV